MLTWMLVIIVLSQLFCTTLVGIIPIRVGGGGVIRVPENIPKVRFRVGEAINYKLPEFSNRDLGQISSYQLNSIKQFNIDYKRFNELQSYKNLKLIDDTSFVKNDYFQNGNSPSEPSSSNVHQFNSPNSNIDRHAHWEALLRERSKTRHRSHDLISDRTNDLVNNKQQSKDIGDKSTHIDNQQINYPKQASLVKNVQNPAVNVLNKWPDLRSDLSNDSPNNKQSVETDDKRTNIANQGLNSLQKSSIARSGERHVVQQPVQQNGADTSIHAPDSNGGKVSESKMDADDIDQLSKKETEDNK